MKVLLDTHALIWLFEGNEELTQSAKFEIQNPENKIFVSIVSFWEIAIKISIGKLEMDFSMEQLYQLVNSNGIEILPIKVEHTYALRGMPYFHKDTFDRLLISQALNEEMSIVSCDSILDKYLMENQITRIW